MFRPATPHALHVTTTVTWTPPPAPFTKFYSRNAPTGVDCRTDCLGISPSHRPNTDSNLHVLSSNFMRYSTRRIANGVHYRSDCPNLHCSEPRIPNGVHYRTDCPKLPAVNNLSDKIASSHVTQQEELLMVYNLSR